MRAGFAAFLIFLVTMGASLYAPPARAQTTDQNDFAKTMVGQWELSNAERSRTCVLTFQVDLVPGGFKLESEPSCEAALAFMKGVRVWNVRGLDGVRLVDANGAAVVDLAEVESGIFEAQRSGEGIFLLQNLAAARAATRSMDQLIGNWSMVRGSGKVLCGITLTNTPVNGDNFELYLKGRCDDAVKSFAPMMWRLERGEILMQSARGETWRFETDDLSQWRRVPDSADPILLSRQ